MGNEFSRSDDDDLAFGERPPMTCGHGDAGEKRHFLGFPRVVVVSGMNGDAGPFRRKGSGCRRRVSARRR